ncbi:hypothetical protein [Arthrobacter sp. B1805]|uniref:hypothetical protein n=1 Tax=Arthrobacter sp. B1805 TaxID=2058892 RepID=UPI000CE3E6EB|nr:hypothetical protein [Arthrobacter sp. B1805]
MTFRSIGYDTTPENGVTEIDWQQALPRIGSSFYGVDGLNDWKVTAVAGQDRTISIEPGGGWGPGVHDIWPAADGNVTIALAAAMGSPRYDLICNRRNWQPVGGGPSAFTVVPGSATRTIPDGRQHNPGTLDDQPLALVRVDPDRTDIREIIDLRALAGGGGVRIFDLLAREYLNFPGARVMHQDTDWAYVADTNGQFSWQRFGPKSRAYGRVGEYYEPPNSGTRADYVIYSHEIPDPGFPYHVVASATVEAGGGGAGTRWDVILEVAGTWLDAARGDAVAPWFKVNGAGPRSPITGATTVRVIARKQFGSGNFGQSAFNQFFTALVVPA